MKFVKPLSVATLALAALGICAAVPARAQEPALLRDVPPPVAFECSVAATPAASARAPRDAAEAARLFASARQAALLGDSREARDLLSRAVDADSTAANVAFLYARTLEELGEVDLAVREYCRYLALAPGAPDAGDVRQLVGRIAPPVRPGISTNAVERFNTALDLADAGRTAEAERAFADVIALAPSWAAPYHNRALLRVRSGSRADAQNDFQQFIALAPEGPESARVRQWLDQLATPFRRYSPGAAFAIGLIPGAGHYYTGRPVAGTAFLALAGGAAAFGALYQTRHVECLTVPQNDVCPPDQIRDDRVERPYLVPAAGVAAAAVILGALDAARGARRHNERGAELGSTSIVPAVEVRHARVDVALLRLRF